MFSLAATVGLNVLALCMAGCRKARGDRERSGESSVGIALSARSHTQGLSACNIKTASCKM
jgi:hypothetical protein